MQEAPLECKKVLLTTAAEVSLRKQTCSIDQIKLIIAEICEMITSATHIYTPADMLAVKGAMINKLKPLAEHYESKMST